MTTRSNNLWVIGSNLPTDITSRTASKSICQPNGTISVEQVSILWSGCWVHAGVSVSSTALKDEGVCGELATLSSCSILGPACSQLSSHLSELPASMLLEGL